MDKRENLGRIFSFYFIPPKWAKLFLTWSNEKQYFFIFSFQVNWETNFFFRLQLATYEYVCMLNKKLNNDADFKGVQAKFAHALWGSVPSEKATVQSEIFYFGIP